MTQTSREIDLQLAVEEFLQYIPLSEKEYLSEMSNDGLKCWILKVFEKNEVIYFRKLGTLSEVAQEFYTQLNADDYEEHLPERG